jgi:peptidoglycan/LPS O-acetylase OafA/YrhL
MRAFAVLLVVIAHAGLGKIVPGGSGVTIFFSISGFIITYLLLRERDKTNAFSASGFYFRRIVKIAPPFILLVILPTLIAAIWRDTDWAALTAQLLFVFNWFYMGGEVRGFDGTDVVWSLSIEEQFYIVFALIWLFAVKSYSWRPIVAGVAVLAVAYSTIARVVMAATPGMADRIYYGSDTRLDGIAWGVLAAAAFHYLQERDLLRSPLSRTLASDWTFLTSIIVYLISLMVRDEWFRETIRYTLQSIAACCIIVYGLLPGNGKIRGVFYSVAKWRVVSLIGLASYSIYLAHLVLMNSIRDALEVPAPAKLLILCTLGVVAGVVVYKYVELPTQRFASTLRKSRSGKHVPVRG